MKQPPLAFVAALASLLLCVTGTPARAADSVTWKKVTIDPAFRSEGVAVADINRDKKLDVIVGDFWYEAPNWTRHEIRLPAQSLGDGARTPTANASRVSRLMSTPMAGPI